MNSEKHTPGPWKPCMGSHKDSCICGLIWAGDTNVATVAVARCPSQDHGECAAPDEVTKANTRLICAAPDLLAACQEALPLVRNRGNLSFMAAEAMLKHAIAKATGG